MGNEGCDNIIRTEGGVRRPPGPLLAVHSIEKVADVRPERGTVHRSNLASFPSRRALRPGPFPYSKTSTDSNGLRDPLCLIVIALP